MKEIRLLGVSQIAGQKCVLREANGILALIGEKEALLANMRIGEANVRIRLPSFLTTRYLSIDSDSGETLFFEATPGVVEQIRALLDECAGQDPEGTSAVYRARAMRGFLIGGGSLLLGITITGISLAYPSPQGTFYVMTGLLAFGAFEICRGIYFTIKA